MKTAALAAAAALALVAAGCGGSCSTGGAAAATSGFRSISIHVLDQNGQVLALVPVTINGKGPFTFALDTGASQSLVDAQVATELGVRRTGSSEKVAGVASTSSNAQIVVKHWSVGGVTLPPTKAVEANLPFGNAHGGVQGLLGSDMLSRFDVVTIDYAHQVLRLHRRSSG